MELRKAAERYPMLAKGHLEAMKPVNEILLDRFTQLQLKEEPFQRGPLVSEADADKFFALKIAVVVPDKQLRRREVKRADLQAGRAAKFFETHVNVDPYKIEIRKACWYGQLQKLSRAHEGELPPVHVAQLYATFKCEFGCAPPVVPPEEFLAMGGEVPLPQRNDGGKYNSFEDCIGKPTPLQLPELKATSKELATVAVLQKDKLCSTVKCSECGRRRGVYVMANPDRVKVRFALSRWSRLRQAPGDGRRSSETGCPVIIILLL